MAPRPDLILLDISLPKKDGFELLGYVKSQDLFRSTVAAERRGQKNGNYEAWRNTKQRMRLLRRRCVQTDFSICLIMHVLSS
jgi:CheY-like chemotaxis protein